MTSKDSESEVSEDIGRPRVLNAEWLQRTRKEIRELRLEIKYLYPLGVTISEGGEEITLSAAKERLAVLERLLVVEKESIYFIEKLGVEISEDPYYESVGKSSALEFSENPLYESVGKSSARKVKKAVGQSRARKVRKAVGEPRARKVTKITASKDKD